MKAVSFEEGIERAIEMIDSLLVRPRLVAVYGEQNAGKTELLDILAIHFRSKSLLVVNSEGYVPPKSIEELSDPIYDWHRRIEFCCPRVGCATCRGVQIRR